ncbi:MAG: hypothetical protein H7335_09170 [Massilia sp.]|nr:hypothetical protein [Massilia sp.]
MHLIVLGMLAPPTERAVGAYAALPIAVTLLPAAPASAEQMAPPPSAAWRAPMPTPGRSEFPAIAHSAAPDATSLTSPDTTSTAPTAEATAPFAGSIPIAGAGWNALPPSQGEAPIRMPGRYRTRMPPSACSRSN